MIEKVEVRRNEKGQQERVFYIAPYLTELMQNIKKKKAQKEGRKL